MSISVLEDNVGVGPGVIKSASVACLLDCCWVEVFSSVYILADGMSECSATLDDSVSEEEEGSFDELTDVTPYLQPGVELSVLNEVRLRRDVCHVTLTYFHQKCVLNLR